MASIPTQSDSQICKKRRTKKQQQNRVKMITGYIIYASEIRKEIIKKNPEKDFGGISKIVGAEWKSLPQETKVTYEKRAQEQNDLQRELSATDSLNKLADVAAARAAENEVLQVNPCSVVVQSSNSSPNVESIHHQPKQELKQEIQHHQQQQPQSPPDGLHVVAADQSNQEHDNSSVDLKTEDSIDIDSNYNNNQTKEDCTNQMMTNHHQLQLQQRELAQLQQHLQLQPSQSYFQQHHLQAPPPPPMTSNSAAAVAANYQAYAAGPNPYCQYCYPPPPFNNNY